MGNYRTLLWEGGGAGICPPGGDRGRPFRAYIPDLLAGRDFFLPSCTAADISDAERAIARLESAAMALSNNEGPARLLLCAEALASSQIEGIEISPPHLLRALAEVRGLTRDADSSELLANVRAMVSALENPSAPITIGRLNSVHRELLMGSHLADHAGVPRKEQNWIGGSGFTPCGAAFIPPPPDLVPELLADLCVFCNSDEVSPVAQAAIAHAQFETIHPYIDGNGRTGRALIQMVLRRRGLASRAIVPISLILAAQSKAYVAALQQMRTDDESRAAAALARWLEMFAVACQHAVAHVETFEKRIAEIVAEWRLRLGPVRADASSLALMERLPLMPIVTVKGASIMLRRTYAAANNAIADLVDARILNETGKRRNRVFEATVIVDAFTHFAALPAPLGFRT